MEIGACFVFAAAAVFPAAAFLSLERGGCALSERVRVVVVDDQYLARGFFEGLVRMSGRYELAASLPDAEQAMAFCDEHPVDLVIMDVMMKYGLDGLTCARSIKASHPEVKVILTTSTAEAEWLVKARRAMIDSFWYKEYSAVALTEVMDRTMDGESVYPDSPPNPEFGEARKADLTDREQEVLRELTRNYTNEEIAQRLHISVNTVRNHIQHMIEKTGYKNRIDLAVNAKALGVVVHEDDRTENRPQKGGNKA